MAKDSPFNLVKKTVRREVAEAAEKKAARGAARKVGVTGASADAPTLPDLQRSGDVPTPGGRVGNLIPDQVEPALKARKEGLGRQNIRHIDPAEALRIAQSGSHIRPSGTKVTRGAYVGAPYSMRNLDDLEKIRAAFDADVAAGAGGADWYQRVHPWIKEMVGDDPVAQRELAQNLALFSSQANPDTNLGFSVKARNANIMGMAEGEPIIHTGLQAEKYSDAFKSGNQIFEQTQDEAKKTNIYGQHLDPTATNPNTGTNDIWHARAFGYTDEAGKPWDAALSAEQHAWLDAETVLATERANKLKLGGKDDWTPGQIQAAAWVAKKGRDYAEKRFNKASLNKETFDPALAANPAIKKDKDALSALRKEHTDYTQGPITGEQFDTGLGEAAKTYPDYMPKYTFNATGESVPGKTTGHLPAISGGTQQERDDFAKLTGHGWKGDRGRDVIYASQGAYTGPSNPMVGRFGGETNVGETAHPGVSFSFDPDTKERILDPASEQLVRGSEATRGYFDAQDAAAGSIAVADPALKVGNTKGYALGGIPFNAENMNWLGDKRDTLRDIVHYGGDQGLLTNFAGRDEANFGKRPAAALEAEIQQQFPGATVTPVGVQGTYVGYGDAPEGGTSAWSGGAAPGEKPIEGTDRATNMLFENLNDAQIRKLDSPEMRAKVQEKHDRDALLEAAGHTVRKDIQAARRIFAKDGFAGLKAALGTGVLPVAAGAAILKEMGSQGGPAIDQQSPPQRVQG